MRRTLALAALLLAACNPPEVDVAQSGPPRTEPTVAAMSAVPAERLVTTTTVPPTTQAPTATTTAVVTAAASAPVPYTSSVWDRLAECESGGDWSTNTGNGYSGGLQWHPDTWDRAGGTRYAPYAWQATREQEIAVAEAWLARTSWDQWPDCSKRLGLR